MLFQQALPMSAVPEHEEIVMALAAGRADEAEQLARAALVTDDRSADLKLLLAESLRRQGKPDEALTVCEALLEKAPDDARAWLETGRCLNNLGRLPRARSALQHACELAPGDAAAQQALGHVQQRLGELPAARECFQLAVQLSPEWAQPRIRLGLLELENEQFAAAREALQSALRIADDDANAWTALGVACHRLGASDDAMSAYRRALALEPAHASALGNLGISQQDAGELEAAISSYRQALKAQPGDHRAAEHLANALLEAGDCEQALAVSGALLQRFPGHSGALASQLVALSRLGRREEYERLLDLERMVMSVDIDPPEGYQNLEDFNQALTGHVLKHESLRYEPAGHATRKGHHTGDLLRYEKGPVAALQRAAESAVQKYLGVLREFPGHPLATAAPEHWRMSLWSVVMDSAGYQLPHIHPTAWLSGVYYARIPEVVSEDDADQAGWIEFGRPPGELAGNSNFPVRRAAPRAGRMFLFPAFLYHQTVPFVSKERRISLAFDIAPLAGATINV